MAEAITSAARDCVECGTKFARNVGVGRPRMRCEDCGPSKTAPPRVTACVDCGEASSQIGGRPRQRCPACSAQRIRHRAAERWAGRTPPPARPLGKCGDCGAEVTPPRCGNMPKRCRSCTKRHDRRRRAKVYYKVDHVCRGCGATFRPKKSDRTSYCSKTCKGADRTRNRTTWPFSSVHFTNCRQCSGDFAARTSARYCSDPCRDQGNRSAYELAKAAIIPERLPIACPCCHAEFVPQRGRKFCSMKCSRLVSRRVRRKRVGGNKHRHRARKYGVTYEPVDPIRVMERDGWRCQECRRSTPKSLRGTFQPRAPEMDHIIPISKGGPHTYLNTRCLCRECNAAKSDQVGGQLLLFG